MSDGSQTEIHLSRQTFFFCKNSPLFHFEKKLFLFRSTWSCKNSPLFPFEKLFLSTWSYKNSPLFPFEKTVIISVNLELINSLWVPNIFIYNLKTFQVIDVLSKLAGLVKTPIALNLINLIHFNLINFEIIKI